MTDWSTAIATASIVIIGDAAVIAGMLFWFRRSLIRAWQPKKPQTVWDWLRRKRA